MGFNPFMIGGMGVFLSYFQLNLGLGVMTSNKVNYDMSAI